ncbi:low temperature requirement protein A [Angustibacter peucedani]
MPGAEERAESVSWLELFFDLVVVAAVAVLTEGLLDELSWERVGLVVLCYGTIWVSWCLTVLYANVAQDQTRLRTMVVAMFLVALMAASTPLHAEHRGNLFVGAFLVLRVMVARSSLHTGRVLQSLPLLQFGGATAPWIASLWVPAPAKYWVWAGALVVELVMLALRGDQRDDEMLQRLRERTAERERRSRSDRTLPELVAVDLDRTHLDERLGLFVIIVLGESVVQLVHAASVVHWTGPFEWVALASFVLLIGLWRNTFAHGFTGAPHTSLADLPPRLGLPLHLFSTLGLVLVAGALALQLEHTTGETEWPVVGLLCGGLATTFVVSLVAGLVGRAPRRWLLWSAGAPLVVVAVLAGVGHLLHPVAFAWLAAAPAVALGISVRPRDGGAATA